jgi:hypothetical protein
VVSEFSTAITDWRSIFGYSISLRNFSFAAASAPRLRRLNPGPDTGLKPRCDLERVRLHTMMFRRRLLLRALYLS